eukprot:3474223-Pleurochrysis_carterae.AAC.1
MKRQGPISPTLLSIRVTDLASRKCGASTEQSDAEAWIARMSFEAIESARALPAIMPSRKATATRPSTRSERTAACSQ